MRIPELLSPAGNLEKLKAAILYGADAVYLAGDAFGMRAAADNFTLEELSAAIDYAHARGVKVYLAVNTMPREYDYLRLSDYLSEVAKIAPDALIVADVGVISLVKRMMPDMEIHISTQANAVSSMACRAWHEMGAKRVVLARELSLDEIKMIRDNVPDTLELEAFIHGSMCISYSGRCLLSGFLTGRDANMGACTQPCRWNFSINERHFDITEEKRPDIQLPITEINGESFIMSSKDTSVIGHIPELVEAGIDSFKIEGRMKSAYYTACTTNVYRMALDSYAGGNYAYNPLWERELDSVSHREYGTGYYFSNSHENANTASDNGYVREKAYLASVVEYNSNTGEAVCIQKNKMNMGDRAELLTPHSVGVPFAVGEMFDENHSPIVSTPHPQMKFYLKMPFEVKVGDIIRASNQ